MFQTYTLRKTRSKLKCANSNCFYTCFASSIVCMSTRGCASAMICNDNAHKNETHNLSYPPGRSECACGTRTRRYTHRYHSATLHPRPMKTDIAATTRKNQTHQYHSGIVALACSINCAVRANAGTSVFIERRNALRCGIGNRAVWMPPCNASPTPSSTSATPGKAIAYRSRMAMHTGRRLRSSRLGGALRRSPLFGMNVSAGVGAPCA